MIARKLLRSAGGVFLPSMLLLAGCPQRCGPTSAPPVTAPPAGVQFFAGFETPNDFYDRFDIQLHSGGCCDQPTPLADSWEGDHNGACEGPDTSRVVRGGAVRSLDPKQLTWWCAPGGDAAKGHIMTSVQTGGYVILSFSPRQFFTDVSKVCWDINATELGGGKWTNIIVVDEATYRRNAPRMDYIGDPGLDSSAIPLPANSLFVKDFRGQIAVQDDSVETFWSGTGSEVVTPDKAARYTRCVEDLNNGNLRVTVARPTGVTDTYTMRGTIPDGRVKVIFEDDSYNPDKHGGTNGAALTWHWDNITIS
jgi:hypothetical protein